MRLLFDENKALSSYPKRSGLSIKKERIIKRASRLVVGLTHTYFHDLQEEKKVEIKEFNGVNYVIESAIQIFKWRFINEKKTISGYECLKAMTTLELLNRKGITDTLKITAWYTKEIPYSFGPKNYVGLPGLILELHEGENRFSYIVDQVRMRVLENVDLVFPIGAEIVTEVEFKKEINSQVDRFSNN